MGARKLLIGSLSAREYFRGGVLFVRHCCIVVVDVVVDVIVVVDVMVVVGVDVLVVVDVIVV